MSWLPTLAAWPFAAAGLAAAVATLLVHLLNRRRPQAIEWGAMDFLREAMQKNQRTIRWRDALLLALRCLAIFLLGLALARPQFAGQHDASALQPVHLIVAMDNSLSMAFETLDGTLLRRAKQDAARLLDHVPPGSLVSVIPTAGSARQSPALPIPPGEEALAVIRQMEIADRTTDLESTIARISRVANLSADLPKRVVVFTDLQGATWRDVAEPKRLDRELPWQLVDVSPNERDNTSIAGVRVLGGFAISKMRSTIIATVRRSGGRSARDVEVRLVVDEVTVGSRTLKLPPGDSQQRIQFTHAFPGHANSATQPADSIVSVAITPDRLPQDDTRHVVVPVFNRWPVVFVDQFGADAEEPTQGKVGETWTVRRLLVPEASVQAKDSSTHVSPSQLSDEHLAGARAVVVAGVRDPRLIAGKLRTFVESGGQLLIAAGGDFDPVAWNASGWLGGRSILPVELGNKLAGQTPNETAEELQPWLLDTASLVGCSLFRLEGNSTAELLDLYSEPLFFKHAAVDESSIDEDVRVLAQMRSLAGREQREAVPQRVPLLVERRTRAGRTLLLTTGLRPQWNTLSRTNAVVILDRIVRDLVRDTMPVQDFETSPKIELPLPSGVQRSGILLFRPDKTTGETLALGAREEGSELAVTNALERGVYRLTASYEGSGAAWNFPLAVNGPSFESDLAKADDAALARFATRRNVARTNFGDSVSLHDMFQPPQGIAWWLVALVLGLMLVESIVLTASSVLRSSERRRAISPAALPTPAPPAGG